MSSRSGRGAIAKTRNKAKVNADSSAFGQLPNEIKLYIFSYLPFPRELCNAALVCSSWYGLSCAPSLWRRLDFSHFPLLSDHTFRDIMQNKCDNSIIELNLEGNQTVSSLAIKKYCHKFTELKRLSFNNCNHIHEDALQKAITSCTALEELDISCCAITEATITTIATCASRTSLRSLGLQALLLGEVHVAQLLSALPALSRLNLSYCNLTDDALFHIASRATATAANMAAPLVSLNLRYNPSLTADGVRLLTSLSTLEELRLGGVKCVDDDTLTALAAGLPRLKVLDLTSLKKLTPATVANLVITRWPQLVELRLVNTDLPNDPTLSRLPFVVAQDPKPQPQRTSAKARGGSVQMRRSLMRL